MKKIFFVSALLLVFNIPALAQPETTAREVLEAYKNKNVELLKKNAPGILQAAISESYFKDANIKKDLEAVNAWDGVIRDIRYESDNVMGKQICVATVYYSDASDEMINAVILSSYDNQNWVILGSGLGQIKKKDFNNMSHAIESNEVKKEKKAVKNFSVELANGDTFNQPTQEKIVECLNSLDEDNFFIILSEKENFLQAAYSDEGFVVEYKENGILYAANDILSKESAIDLFIKYFQGQKDWNKNVTWSKD